MTVKEWTGRVFGLGGLAREPPPRPRKYMVREGLAQAHDDVAIEDENGQLAFSVDGRALQIRGTLVLRDRFDDPLYRIPQHELHRKDAMEIERGDGGAAATVWRARTPGGRDHWAVTIAGSPPMRLHGGVADGEFAIESGGRPVAEVSRRWFRQPRSYGVAVLSGEDDALVVMIAVAVDQMLRR